MLNGVGYVFFGVPSRDLEKTWKDVTDIETTNKDGDDPLLGERFVQTISTSSGVGFFLDICELIVKIMICTTIGSNCIVERNFAA